MTANKFLNKILKCTTIIILILAVSSLHSLAADEQQGAPHESRGFFRHISPQQPITSRQNPKIAHNLMPRQGTFILGGSAGLGGASVAPARTTVRSEEHTS